MPEQTRMAAATARGKDAEMPEQTRMAAATARHCSGRHAMSGATRKVLFVLLAVLMALTFYGIFNAGNPNSMFRMVVKDTRYDVLITLILSAGIVVLVLLLGTGSAGRLKSLLDMNKEYILDLRRKGRSDEQIAESFLHELKARPGILRSLVKLRVLRYLSRLR